MVHGLDKFKEYFSKHTNKYVFIGGTACDIHMNEIGVPFRATKDLDIVLIIEALDKSFGEDFWRFIEDGGYVNLEKSTGVNQFYRFTKPKNSSFPKMIELFSRIPDNIQIKPELIFTPIHISESVDSLSAILLDNDYYEILKKGMTNVNGFSVINTETIILFKIKAWLDLKERKMNKEDIDTRNIKKHKNDVFRLLITVDLAISLKVNDEIMSDIRQFSELIYTDEPDLLSLGIKNVNLESMMLLLKNIFII